MYPHPSPMLMSGGGLARYIGATSRTGDGALAWPSGAFGGDLALVIASTDSAEITGWTKDDAGSSIAMFWKRLEAGDITSPPSISGAGGRPVIVLIYRGALAAAKRTQQTTIVGGSQTVGGFTKVAGSKGVVSAYSRGGWSAFTSGPAGFAVRVNADNGGGNVGVGAADILRPGDYTDNADMVWTTSGSLSGGGLGIELL